MKYICIHGHFYQPPRENPWLEEVELQDSAHPYHDWNARITAECYGSNAWARILNKEGRIAEIRNNYAYISFDFGPTLLSWLAEKAPSVYQAILEADRESQRRFGRGSAMAQAYNHIILPLANSRDKRTQVVWGIRDFEARFGRRPEGMWLPETAVDLETLEILAEEGIAFTILAPHQARRVRPLGQETWEEVAGGRVDPTRPYLVRLPSGRRITVLFYDGPLSQAVAFGGLLQNGEGLAGRLLELGHGENPLIHIATDGETYGHHHPFGDMALAYALKRIEGEPTATLTNYAAYLAKHPPTWEVEIVEGSSWSCAHGVERWRDNCGCQTGAHPGWTQAWRRPLREAMDWLRDRLAPLYEGLGRRLLKDPWAARDDYISVILDRSPQNVQGFLERWQTHPLSPEERVQALELLELQRHALLMYTSCGWFFDEISGIETVQILQYAARAIQLGEKLFGEPLEEPFLRILEQAPSNIEGIANGKVVYERFVRPAIVEMSHVAAHYALSALFEDYPETFVLGAYRVDRVALDRRGIGQAKLLTGRVRVTSRLTGEEEVFQVAAFHLGDPNPLGGVRPDEGETAYKELAENLGVPFSHADFPKTLKALYEAFPSLSSLQHLFKDKQRQVLDRLLAPALEEAEGAYRELFAKNEPHMRALAVLGVPIPEAFQAAARFALTASLRRELASEHPDLKKIQDLWDQAQTLNLALDQAELAYALQQALEKTADRWKANLEDPGPLRVLSGLATLIPRLSRRINVWYVQNVAYEASRNIDPQILAQEGAWARDFLNLCEALGLEAPKLPLPG